MLKCIPKVLSHLSITTLVLFYSACASNAVLTTSAEVKSAERPINQRVACRIKHQITQKNGSMKLLDERAIAFTEKNSEGQTVVTEIQPVTARVNAMCEATGRLACVFTDPRNPTIVRSSASTLGDTLSLNMVDGPDVFEIDCAPRS